MLPNTEQKVALAVAWVLAAVALLVAGLLFFTPGCTTVRDVVLLPLDVPSRMQCLRLVDADVDGANCYFVMDACRLARKEPVGFGCLPPNQTNEAPGETDTGAGPNDGGTP